jgi:peptide/nickel transport system permease protein
MGISPTELAQQDVSEEPVVVKQDVAGRSPTKIALDRLRADKIAMICFATVILFILIACFAGPLCHLFGVQLDAGDPSRDLDQFNFPTTASPGRLRWASPRTPATTTWPSGSTAPGPRWSSRPSPRWPPR